ncbi:MAG: hypothetical protein KatS3mg111_1292 [Pirellulaceae bacterium]|nr:MAG: hypothetical protein KatS3mg111_1292 [Pirellulaceae bacterium]
MSSSNVTTEIESIVQIVLQRLQEQFRAPGEMSHRPWRTDQAGASAAGGEPHRLTGEGTAGGRVNLHCRVLALATLREVPPDTTELVVPARCVVTPAVIDELRQRGWKLTRRAAAVAGGHQVSPYAGLLLSDGGAHNVAWPGERLQGSGDIPADVRRVTAHLAAGGQWAVWWTSRPFAAMHNLVRARDTRPVMLPRLDDLARAEHQTQPNVWVIDRETWTGGQVERLGHYLFTPATENRG